MKKIEYIVSGIVSLICFILMIIFNIECPIKTLFDIDCAGCGGTRMIFSLLRFDFYQAFRFNPFLFLLGVVIFSYLLYVLICILLKKEYKKVGTKALIVVCVLTILFMLFRNINGFEFLKPTIVR